MIFLQFAPHAAIKGKSLQLSSANVEQLGRGDCVLSDRFRLKPERIFIPQTPVAFLVRPGATAGLTKLEIKVPQQTSGNQAHLVQSQAIQIISPMRFHRVQSLNSLLPNAVPGPVREWLENFPAIISVLFVQRVGGHPALRDKDVVILEVV